MNQINKSFTHNTYTCTITVEDSYAGQRLDNFILIFFPSISREQIKKKIHAGHIIISQRQATHRPSTKVREGEVVTVSLHRTVHEDEIWYGNKIHLQTDPEIIYQDDQLLAISKPPFMSTHPTGRHLFYCATVYFAQLLQRPVHSVHRLDRETSGVLLLAKNPHSAHQLTSAFEHGQVKKCYFFAAKILPAFRNSPVLAFARHERLGVTGEGRERVLVQAFPPESSSGKEAHTDFQVILSNQTYALALAFPHTGRQHQIRVHALCSGLPLIGDKLYLGGYSMFQRFKDGKASEQDHQEMELPRQALHAIALAIRCQQQQHLFVAPLPTDLQEWIRARFAIDVLDFQKHLAQAISDYFLPPAESPQTH